MTERGEQRPAYLVVADDLRAAIERDEYSAQRRLPTESELANRYQLSRQTIRRAYLELVGAGLVDRIPGRGTFVADHQAKYARQFGSFEDLLGLAEDTSIELVRPLGRQVDIAAAARLGLDDDIVYSLGYVRSHHDIAFGWTTVSMPPRVAEIVSDTTEFTTLGTTSAATVIGLLEGRLPDPIDQAQQSIAAVAADDVVAGFLGCAPGSPILRIDRLFVSSRAEPVELSVGYFLPDQYTYRTNLLRQRTD
ncbi:GntR family transcriptional regulator [Nocardia alni]|uniref:GntR family transcriptional regulator n=1 Tax=Nocardia alni TaxID=2815723 RepID=UPI001C2356CD|nr:GntR family transcriptional regulator [Nocardia alni]